ncbi:MAG: hypothetical protein HC916_14605 [Coleofasciculaceae cyanobacterium SM2_1_6]|nr:hypothetical protein [Coleofasciculaceae cyanobacterium SM2_1_6]
MNPRESFVQWLNLFPEKYTDSNKESDLIPIVEYFLMALEDGVFDEFGVVWQGETITYRGQKYYHPYSASRANTIYSFELLFQYLLGFSPRVFAVWGDLSKTPRGKFAQAIMGVVR